MSFTYQGRDAAFDPAAQIWNLNAMHQAAGGVPHKAPAQWLRSAQARELIAALEGTETVEISHSLVESGEGRCGGTWACVDLAIVYAHYLSPQFCIQWNRWTMGRMQQERASQATQLAATRRRPLAEGAIDVLRVLAELGGQGRPEDVLARLPGSSRGTVRQRLARLALRGELRRRALGLYELPYRRPALTSGA